MTIGGVARETTELPDDSLASSSSSTESASDDSPEDMGRLLQPCRSEPSRLVPSSASGVALSPTASSLGPFYPRFHQVKPTLGPITCKGRIGLLHPPLLSSRLDPQPSVSLDHCLSASAVARTFDNCTPDSPSLQNSRPDSLIQLRGSGRGYQSLERLSFRYVGPLTFPYFALGRCFNPLNRLLCRSGPVLIYTRSFRIDEPPGRPILTRIKPDKIRSLT
ncbi:hypothetical protein OUZ56_030035 [Daphnia magna]|uniref:Uncharacterized protein n=1 Tax=Daphnia magna TaxID=35525 RepID=A0ABQ9ZQ38_9CRUS|nr:hypothetical protein OUZ56_030035 [Daphnia magna]